MAWAVLLHVTPACAWQARLHGDGPGSGVARAVALAANGDVAAGGYLDQLQTGADFAVVRLDGATGAEVWRVVLSGPSDNPNVVSPERAIAVAVDAGGDVIAAGMTTSPARTVQFTAVKLMGATGTTMWRYDLPDYDGHVAAMAVDADGNVVLAGDWRDGDHHSHAVIMKLAGDTGTPLWRVDGDGAAAALALRPDDDVVVAGALPEAATVRLAGATGVEQWRSAASPNASDPKLALTPTGDVITSWVLGIHNGTVARLAGGDGAVAWSRDHLDIIAQIAVAPVGEWVDVATNITQPCFGGIPPGPAYDFRVQRWHAIDGTDAATASPSARTAPSPSVNVPDHCLSASGAGGIVHQPDGDVIVVGGRDQGLGATFAAERYGDDPFTQRWRIDGRGPGTTLAAVPGHFATVAAVRHDLTGVASVGAARLDPLRWAFSVVTLNPADGALLECGDGVQDPGEACDDGNLSADDCCPADCQTRVADGSACDDHDLCTGTDVCTAGLCAGTTLPCAPCGTCSADVGCRPAPLDFCGGPTEPNGGMLSFSRHGKARRLAWNIRKGTLLGAVGLGDPLEDTSYVLCTYSRDGGMGMAVAPAGACAGSRSCWRRTRSGFRYADPTAPWGLSSLVLRAGAEGRARIAARGRGAHLALLGLPVVDGTVSVQLRQSDNLSWCFATAIDKVARNSRSAYRGSGK